MPVVQRNVDDPSFSQVILGCIKITIKAYYNAKTKPKSSDLGYR